MYFYFLRILKMNSFKHKPISYFKRKVQAAQMEEKRNHYIKNILIVFKPYKSFKFH